MGNLAVIVNGVNVGYNWTGTDQGKAMAQLRAQIDFIDREPVNGNRWGATWYAPGTFTLCESGHPVALGGQCEHFTCRREQES